MALPLACVTLVKNLPISGPQFPQPWYLIMWWDPGFVSTCF